MKSPTGQITGWTSAGKGNNAGKRTSKNLARGKEKGLNPADKKWTRMAAGVGVAAAGGLTLIQILEYVGVAALAF